MNRPISFLAGLAMTLGALLVTGCEKSSSKPGLTGTSQLAIIGGKEVTPEDAISRSIVMIYNKKPGTNSGTLCTGSILSDSVIVTAAHCLRDEETDRVVYFGLNFDMPLHAREILGLHIAREYNRVEKIEKKPASERTAIEALSLVHMDRFDLALIRFAGGLPPGYRAAKFLEDETALVKGAKVHIAGYGITGIDKPDSSGILRSAVADLWIPQFNEGEALIDISGGHGACSGDSGGPTYIEKNGEYFLFGVTSRNIAPLSEPNGCLVSVAVANLQRRREWLIDAEKLLPPAPAISEEPPASPPKTPAAQPVPGA